MEIQTRNINTGFHRVIGSILNGEVETRQEGSRAGAVLRIPEPALLTYSHPRERVLLNPARDANPFFMLYEALWMLTGRNDAASLGYYNSRIPTFSDDGETLNDAYGHRWRHHVITHRDAYQGIDQIQTIIDHLRRKPDSRRAVLQMWNVEDDLLKIDDGKAVCCNTEVLFSLQQTGYGTGGFVDGSGEGPLWVLDMTVINRSNDLVWSVFAGDYVTFSVLQEYLAANLGVGVGTYHHFSNNLHAYVSHWQPEAWLADWDVEAAGKMGNQPFPLIEDSKQFDEELPSFITWHASRPDGDAMAKWQEPFLHRVAHPLLMAYHRRHEDREASSAWLARVEDVAWRQASYWWLERRWQKSRS